MCQAWFQMPENTKMKKAWTLISKNSASYSQRLGTLTPSEVVSNILEDEMKTSQENLTSEKNIF